MTIPIIEFSHVKKSFDDNVHSIISDLSFKIDPGEFITILGTSGSGKTTTLKMINRLVEPDSGVIRINGEVISENDVVSLRRQIGYVVQQIGLFPHMTVAQNIATVPTLLKWKNDTIQERVDELLNMMQLPPELYRHRYPKNLSGGQQQRVGVARALAANPEIMLLDEPFGAVDAITRNDLQQQIKRIHQTLGANTFLFVTHDINEAFKLGHKVIIMDQGTICQFDTPYNIIKHPNNDFIKQLLVTVYEEQNMWESFL